jgi:excisionase family DNA binding protein
MSTIQAASRDERRKLALSVAEAAVEAGVGRDQVYGAIKSGQLIAKKWGRRTIIRRDDLEEFLAALPPLKLPPSL